MVRESVNLLELLRKQAARGDLDFLREAVAVLAEAVMEAEVPPTASAAPSASPGATATGRGAGTRAPAASSCKSRSCARAATSRPCSSRAGAPSAPCSRWSSRPRGGRLDPPRRRPRTFAPARASPRARSHLRGARHRRHELPERPLDGGPYRSGSTRSPNAYARRAASPRSASSSPPPHVGTSEDGAFWLSFLRGLVARGLSLELVTSDAHQGLRAAIATVFGGALRCRTHLWTCSRACRRAPISLVVRTIFQQPSAEAVHAQCACVSRLAT